MKVILLLYDCYHFDSLAVAFLFGGVATILGICIWALVSSHFDEFRKLKDFKANHPRPDVVDAHFVEVRSRRPQPNNSQALVRRGQIITRR